MRRALLGTMMLTLAACGSSDTAGEGDGSGDTAGDEAMPVADTQEGADSLANAPEEPEEPEGPTDGSRCLPVANCNSFANQTCVRVSPDGAVTGEDGEPMEGVRVLDACPDGDNVDSSVQECFSYVDRGQQCRRPPAVRQPEWPCAFEGDACQLGSF